MFALFAAGLLYLPCLFLFGTLLFYLPFIIVVGSGYNISSISSRASSSKSFSYPCNLRFSSLNLRDKSSSSWSSFVLLTILFLFLSFNLPCRACCASWLFNRLLLLSFNIYWAIIVSVGKRGSSELIIRLRALRSRIEFGSSFMASWIEYPSSKWFGKFCLAAAVGKSWFLFC